MEHTPKEYTFPDGALIEFTAMSDSGHSFTGWGGDASGNQNPLQLIMDAGKSIIAMFTQDSLPPPPPSTDRTLIVTIQGQGTVMVNQITQLPPPPPGSDNYDWKVSNIDSGADWDSPQSIDYGAVKSGDSILLEGTYTGVWAINGRSGIYYWGRNFTIQDGSDKGIDLRNSNDLNFCGENNDRNNFKILHFGYKHFRIDQCSNLLIKALHIETATSGGQTDDIYCQNTDDITVKNCSLIINNNGGGHNDCFQGYRIGGEVLIEGNTCLQNNDKDTDNQGIYITTPSRDKLGTYRYLNNYLGGVNSTGGRSKIKNCLTVRVTGGHKVPVRIIGNEVVSDGYHYVYLTGITDYNLDIREVNNFKRTKFGKAGVTIL